MVLFHKHWYGYNRYLEQLSENIDIVSQTLISIKHIFGTIMLK